MAKLYTVQSGIPIRLPNSYRKTPEGQQLMGLIDACNDGDSFLVESEKQFTHAYILARRAGKKAIRRQEGNHIRIWIVERVAIEISPEENKELSQ